MATEGQGRYHFNQSGIVKEIVYPNKAILAFKLNKSGQDEKAILLSKYLTIDGKQIEENKLMQDALKINDVVHFDCHVYDKGESRMCCCRMIQNLNIDVSLIGGGLGSGKDRCNFFAMKAWKNSADYELRNGSGTSGGLIYVTHNGNPVTSVGNSKVGTGWVSELNPRKGVLTFDNNGRDERVLFLASKVYFFEKRIGSKQPLTDFLSEGDPVQFEAVPQDVVNDEKTSNNSYCSWFANLVWKGRKPQVGARRGSCDSSSDTEQNSTEEYVSYGNRHPGNPDIVKGIGMIAKIVNDKEPIWQSICWNHLVGQEPQSVSVSLVYLKQNFFIRNQFGNRQSVRNN